MELKIPPIIVEEYDKLYDLVQNQSHAGRLYANQVCNAYGWDNMAFSRSVYNGTCPFAFGDNKGVGRGVIYIPVLPLYNFMTQGVVFKAAIDRDRMPEYIVK